MAESKAPSEDAEEVAAALPRVFAARTLDGLVELLDEDVRWGPDEDTEQTCHSRSQVRSWLGALLDRGVAVEVLQTTVTGPRVMLRLRFSDPDQPASATSSEERYEVLTVRAGRVVDIRPAHDLADAERRLSGATS